MSSKVRENIICPPVLSLFFDHPPPPCIHQNIHRISIIWLQFTEVNWCKCHWQFQCLNVEMADFRIHKFPIFINQISVFSCFILFFCHTGILEYQIMIPILLVPQKMEALTVTWFYSADLQHHFDTIFGKLFILRISSFASSKVEAGTFLLVPRNASVLCWKLSKRSPSHSTCDKNPGLLAPFFPHR